MNGNSCCHRFFFAACLTLLFLLAPVTVSAQAPWKPQRPVELIVGSAAGNSNDLMLRLIAQVTQEKRLLDVPMNVMNKPGGGNSVAWSYLNQRASDGHGKHQHGEGRGERIASNYFAKSFPGKPRQSHERWDTTQ